MSSPSSSGGGGGVDGRDSLCNEENMPLEVAMKAVANMSNMLIAHKIAIEKDFKLEPGMDMTGPLMSVSPIIGSSPCTTENEPSQSSQLHHHVKDIIHDAYWDLFRTELQEETPPTYKLVKQLLADIKQHILDLLLPQHTRLKQEICDKMDPVIIEQQCRNDAFDLKDYSLYVLKTMSKLCAPVRDNRLRELYECQDLVELFRGIMEVLELMRLDLANFTLNKFRPHIKAHSQAYERDKFNEILEQQKALGLDGLEYTKVWLKRAVLTVQNTHGFAEFLIKKEDTKNAGISNDAIDDLELEESEEASQSCPSSAKAMTHQQNKSNNQIKQELLDKILNTAYCELLDWDQSKQDLFPGTLLFDEATYKNLGGQFRVIIMLSSILLTTFAFINQYKLHQDNDFKTTLKSHTITLLTAHFETPKRQSSSGASSPRSSSPLHDKSDKTHKDTNEYEKLETISVKILNDIEFKLGEKNLEPPTKNQREIFRKQILDLQSTNNRVKNLVERRIMEFVETLLNIDIKHQQRKLTPGSVPPVNIPLGLSCLADEITMIMAQFVKIVRYNRVVFYEHYQKIIIEFVEEALKK